MQMESLIWQAAIKPSRHLALLLLALHLGSAAVVYVTSVSSAVKVLAFLLIALSFSYCWARDVWLRLPNSWHEITLHQKGVSVVVREGSALSGRLDSTSVVFSRFVILLVKLEGRYLSTTRVIFRDALHPEVFRELCVYLKFSC